MSYILGQYNYIGDDNNNQNKFMTLIKTGDVSKIEKPIDEDSFDVSNNTFNDECITSLPLQKDHNYYFHGKIKRLSSDQTFDIKLMNKPKEQTAEEIKKQYIKTVTITANAQAQVNGIAVVNDDNNINEWVDIEFIFTPVADDLDTILFELVRTNEDYLIKNDDGTYGRKPILIYQELSEINNLISDKIFKKIGVQSHPGLIMCINGEMIRIGRTGIYELKNGIVNIFKFSVINSAKENNEIDYSINESKCIFNSEKTRTIDPFTLDYMYEEGGEV